MNNINQPPFFALLQTGYVQLTDFELATHLDEWEGGSFQDGRKSWRTRKGHRRQQSTGRTAAYAAPEVIAATEDHR